MDLILTILFLFFSINLGVHLTGKLFNPITLSSLSILINLISVFICDFLDLLRLASINDIKNTYNVILIGQIGFLMPWFLKTKTCIISNSEVNNRITTLKINASISILGIIIVSFLLGGIPIYQMYKGNLSVNEFNDSLTNLPFGIMAIILVSQFVYFLNLIETSILSKNFIKRKDFIVWCFIAILLCFWQGKRQSFLFLLFTSLSYLFLYSDFKFKKKHFIFSVFFFLFFVLLFNWTSFIRNNSINLSESRNFEIIEYAMYAPMNMASILEYYPNSGTTILPSAILTEIVPKRFLSNHSDFKDILFEPSSPSGYFSYWYIDYGYFGVFVGMLLLSLLSKIYYIKQMYNVRFRKAYILILWCCATIGVYNHFISLNFFILPFIFINIPKLKFTLELK